MNLKTREERLIVIGGNAAGMSAASKARRMNSHLQVLALEKTSHVSYSACGIPYYVADQVRHHSELVSITPDEFRAKRGIDVLTQHEVVDISPVQRRVTAVMLSTGKEVAFHYDKLLIAAGGRPFLPTISGRENQQVFTLRTLADGIRIKQFVDQERPRSAALIGGGYIALEMAEAFCRRGISTSIIEKQSRILPGFEPQMAELAAAELAGNKVDVFVNQVATEICCGQCGAVRKVTLKSGQKIPADLVLISAGVQPNTELAAKAGLRLGSTGAIAVDWKMQTSASNIFAAGDCVEVRNLVSGKPDYFPLGTTANKQGRVVGENIGGGTARFRGVVGTAVFKLFDLEIARTGLNLQAATRAGFYADATTVRVMSKAGYYQSAEPITICVVFDKRSGHLLGAQMAGKNGVSKRIDVFATALSNKMKLEDIAHLDLSYAPPFSPVWDPVLVAVNAARGKLRK